jgi:hypothetical protein
MMSEWKKLELAPRDGSLVLAIDQKKEYFVIRWFSIGSRGAWEIYAAGLGSDWGYSDRAFSYWMPLPEPPKEG